MSEMSAEAQLAQRAQYIPDFQKTAPRYLKKELVDVQPHIPAAGTRFEHDGQSVNQCITTQPTDNFEHKSLDEIRWRSTYRGQVGLQASVPGIIGASIPPEDFRHGMRTQYGDKAGDCIHSDYNTELQDFLLAQKEKNYRSHKFEPLGTHYTRGHVLPEKYENDPNARFGVQTASSESVKSILYSGHGIEGSPDSIPSIKESDIAKQKDRKYNWNNMDPNDYRFGRPAENADLSASHGVTSCLRQADPNAAADIKSDRPQQVGNVWHHEVGRRRPLTDSIAKLGPDFVFGQRGPAPDASVKEVIHGSYAPDEQQPDRDLGRTVKALSPLYQTQSQENSDRLFGVPTVRHDKAVPVLRSVSDDTNYGNEPTTTKLMCPAKYGVQGISDDDFAKTRTRQELRTLFALIGKNYSDDAFAEICSEAESAAPLSVKTFRAADNKLNNHTPATSVSMPSYRKPQVAPAPSVRELGQMSSGERVAKGASRYRR